MKTETPLLDTRELAAQIDARYGLDGTRLRFLPLGEEGYSYLAETRDGRRYFVKAYKAQRVADGDQLERALELTYHLHANRGLDAVVAPHRTRDGELSWAYGAFKVALFDYIDGHTGMDVPLTADDLQQTATVLAAIHHSARDLPVAPPREDFSNPFHDTLLRLLRESEAPRTADRSLQRRTRHLFAQQRADILATLDLYADLQARARATAYEPVLTHGDPNPANIITDSAGQLHLIDWGEVAIGPPERDVVFFTGAAFDVFLAAYLAAAGGPTLHEHLFAFYLYRWIVQEIADYGARLLLDPDAVPDDDAYHWGELTPYLPIRHDEVDAGMHAIRAALRRVTESP